MVSRCALAVGALLVALAGCETASCPSNLIQTPSGSCECPPGLRWSEMARACVDSPDGSVACSRDAECDDGAYCNGGETCSPGATGADVRGCLPGTPPCPGFCSEARRECTEECADDDGDGHADVACGGDDCDDTDPNRYPGNIEVCDPRTAPHDEDCDPTTLGPDADFDRYQSDRCCEPRPGSPGVECGTDCNDASSDVNPEAIDTCGGGDQDCDGFIDENPDQTFYYDRDGDGHGILGTEDPGPVDDPIFACGAPPGYAVIPGDCDDTQRGVNPGVPEACVAGMVDDDCDGAIDESCPCTPPASTRVCGHPEIGVCRPGSQLCTSTGWDPCSGSIEPMMEVCDGGRDEDCDGRTDEGCECVNGESRVCGTSLGVCRAVMQTCTMGRWPRTCASEPGVVGPSTDTCDGLLDEDCDGATDEGCECTNGRVDRSACGSSTGQCEQGTRTCAGGRWGACSGGVGPVAEVCDGSRDEDCDGATDEGCGCTNGTTRGCGLGYCAGTQTCTAGVWGACGGASPRAEVCNGIDDDCDGVADNSDPDTAQVGTRCPSTDAGLCVYGTYSCPGATLVCSGVSPVPEATCDHRDQDCDGRIDEGLGVATCTSACSTTSCVQCRGASLCYTYPLVETHPATTATLRSSAGDGSMDWGSSMSAVAEFRVARVSPYSTNGHVSVLVSPTTVPGPADTANIGLPTPAAGASGFAAVYAINGLLHRAELRELTPGGSVIRATSARLPEACVFDDAETRTVIVTLSNDGGTLSATASIPGCGSATATYADTDWNTTIYGESETSGFPRYFVAQHGWARSDASIEFIRVSLTRTRTTTRSHCLACP